MILLIFLDYVIRTVEENDINSVYEMRKIIAKESDMILSSEEEVALDSIKTWVNNWKENDKRLFAVVEHKGEIVAQLWVWFMDNRKKLSHIAEFGMEILKEHRSKGLGKALSKLALEWAVKNGAKRVQAETIERNVPMRKILEGLGFELEGTLKCYLKNGNKYENVVLYGKCISNVDN
ncbi:MAG: GNAT family N-acetyltransferase [Fervidobacterium sp.]